MEAFVFFAHGCVLVSAAVSLLCICESARRCIVGSVTQESITINHSIVFIECQADDRDPTYEKLRQLSQESTYTEVLALLGKPGDVGGSGTVILIYPLKRKGREAAVRVNGVGCGSKVISVIVVEEGKPIEYIVGTPPRSRK